MSNKAKLNGAKSSVFPRSLVAEDLEAVERHLQEAIAPFRKRFGSLVDHLEHYRGKRLRPALVILAAKACGRIRPEHHILGAVVEMIHTATLVHDDVLDEADTRRHSRTINAQWNNNTSILLGDMLLSTAFRLCAQVDARACQWVGDATNRICAGELLQVSHANDLDLSEETYFEIVAGKTGALTEVCTRLGAHYAGTDGHIVEQLAEYGMRLGVAFQIADDVLDLTGDARVVGKTLGSDLEQGKMTLPVIRTLDALSTPERNVMRSHLQNRQTPTILAEIERVGALQSSLTAARLEAHQALNNLSSLPASPYRTALEQIALWSVGRDH